VLELLQPTKPTTKTAARTAGTRVDIRRMLEYMFETADTIPWVTAYPA
jgi:hypothetical protein